MLNYSQLEEVALQIMQSCILLYTMDRKYFPKIFAKYLEILLRRRPLQITAPFLMGFSFGLGAQNFAKPTHFTENFFGA